MRCLVLVLALGLVSAALPNAAAAEGRFPRYVHPSGVHSRGVVVTLPGRRPAYVHQRGRLGYTDLRRGRVRRDTVHVHGGGVIASGRHHPRHVESGAAIVPPFRVRDGAGQRVRVVAPTYVQPSAGAAVVHSFGSTWSPRARVPCVVR